MGEGLEQEWRPGWDPNLLRPRRREDLHEVAHCHPGRRQLQQRLTARGSRLLRPLPHIRGHVHGVAADENDVVAGN
jgi:hypothetical protein